MGCPKKEGNQFELLFERIAHHSGVAIIRIPDGMRRVAFNKIIPVKTPCDWVIALDGKAVLIDCKTIMGSTFSYSCINPVQVDKMLPMATIGGIKAGYIIWMRKANIVVFIPVQQLAECEPNSSLDITQGVYLGSIENCDLKKIFKGDSQKPHN